MTAKRIHFTELAINRLSQEGTYWDTHTRAFGLRVGKTRKTLFIVRSDGSREVVGHVGLIDLKAARRKAQELLLSVHTPHPTFSFKEAFDLYASTRLKNYRERSRNEVTRLVQKHMAPYFTHNTNELNHHLISTILEPLAPSEANHLFGVLRTFFNWCEKRDLCTSPIRKLDKPYKEKSRDRILTDHEIRLLWIATATPSTFHSIVRLCLLTGQRRGEISQIQSGWIKDGWLTFPKEVTKNGSEHSIPVTAQVFTLVASRFQSASLTPSQQLLFPASKSSSQKTSVFNGWSKSKAALDKASGVNDWTLHDLRRTWASLAARWGIPEHLAARIQNHRSAVHTNPIRAVYQRYEFRDEMRDAMELFERSLLQLLAAPTSS